MRARKGLLLLAAAGMAASLGQPAQAGVTGCTLAHVRPDSISATGFTSCTVTSAGTCTYFYDPLFDPFPQLVVPETIEYAVCLTL